MTYQNIQKITENFIYVLMCFNIVFIFVSEGSIVAQQHRQSVACTSALQYRKESAGFIPPLNTSYFETERYASLRMIYSNPWYFEEGGVVL